MGIKFTSSLETGLICIRDLKEIRFSLDNLQDAELDNDQLRLVEDTIWCISNAIENMEHFSKALNKK